MTRPPLLECPLNVSEGREPRVLSALAAAIGAVPQAYLLDQTSDWDHHRSVFTFVGPPEAVYTAVLAVLEVALAAIDLRSHQGVHPRIGAVDVVPLVPLLDISPQECILWAVRIGEEAARRFSLPVYLYGEAARNSRRRRLAFLRRGGFEGLAQALRTDPERFPDFGPSRPHPSGGACAVGVRPILIAFNVLLESRDLELARRIAAEIRESGGGLPAVQALGFPLAARGCVQVSMNLLDYHRTSPWQAFSAVRERARRAGVRVRESELVGLIPRQALTPEQAAEMGLKHFSPDRILEERISACTPWKL